MNQVRSAARESGGRGWEKKGPETCFEKKGKANQKNHHQKNGLSKAEKKKK